MRADVYKEDEKEDEEEDGEKEHEEETDVLPEDQADKSQMHYEGHEMPVADGSALHWAEMVQMVQIRPAPSQGGEEPPPKSLFAPQKVLLMQPPPELSSIHQTCLEEISVGARSLFADYQKRQHDLHSLALVLPGTQSYLHLFVSV